MRLSSFDILDSDLKISFIRSPGPGGQNVNKVATGVLLRFNIHHVAIPESVQLRLKQLAGQKLTLQGDVVIKATRHRTQERNKQDALQRLSELLQRAATVPKKRKKTKPTKSSVEKRITSKKMRGKTKSLRQKKIHE